MSISALQYILKEVLWKKRKQKFRSTQKMKVLEMVNLWLTIKEVFLFLFLFLFLHFSLKDNEEE